MPDFTTCPKCCDQWPQRCFPTAKYKNKEPNPHAWTCVRLGKLPKPKGGLTNAITSPKTRSRYSPTDFLTSHLKSRASKSRNQETKKRNINRFDRCGYCNFETEDVPGPKTKGIQFPIKYHRECRKRDPFEAL